MENLPECLRKAVFWVRSTKDEENERRLEEAIERRLLKDIDELKLKGSWEFTQKDNPIASFVPDIVIKYIQQERFIKLPFRTKFYGIALFADISGFTSLTEKYTQIGTTGIEELTETLNNYIGPVVARIIAAKGDVFKFAGDAILCLWPVKKEKKIPSVLRTVVNCALNIQETYGILTTSLDVKLRIKFGISAGLFDFLICGKETEFIQPICVGEPIVNVQDAQNQCEPGEVIITNEAWQLLKHYHSSYTFIRIKGQFIKVLGKQFQSHTKEREAPTGKERQDVIKGCKTESQLATISLFLLPMLRDLDAKQLEYLAEVRKITTVFMSFPEIDIIKTVGDIIVVVEVVYNCTYDMQGIFNKTVCFDKGCTCLVVFGLPGYKHQDDSARGLLCASKISSKMKQHSIKCSIGITTSVTFCGIIGNPYRQEYTVIGRGVNMAARLMMYYSEHTIICDDVTYEQAKSQLGEENFIILPVKKLKGMQNIKAVYEYRLKETLENLKDIDQFEEPCLGMLKEKAIVTEYLKKIKEETEQKIVYYHVLHHFVIVKGDSGIGKGRFLYWSCLEASNLHYKVITCKVNIAVKDSSLSIVSRILTKLLKLKGIATKVKQKLITTMLRDSEEIQNIPLCLLNELFQIQFPYPKEPLPQDQTTVKNMLFDLLLAMFQKLICDTAPATDLEKVDLPKTMEDLIQQGLNIIKTRQQVLLKTAATLQTEFDVELLAKINPDLPIEEIISECKG